MNEKTKLSGRLFIIATPVGNLGDLTLRSKEALCQADLILAEDTRVTKKLLTFLGLRKRILSCHNFNEGKRLSLLADLKAQNLTFALVCDAGTPLVSDPGFQMVLGAITSAIPVIPIPGPSAFLLALIGSGLPCDRFVFEGFLPNRKGERLKRLMVLATEPRTMIFYLAPHDVHNILQEMLEAFQDRSACLARELTKLHEEFIRMTLSALTEVVSNKGIRGECVLVVEGRKNQSQESVSKEFVLSELAQLLAEGKPLKVSAQEVSKHVGWPKSKVYKLGLELKSTGIHNLKP